MRIWITGIGVVSPLGLGAISTTSRSLARACGVSAGRISGSAAPPKE